MDPATRLHAQDQIFGRLGEPCTIVQSGETDQPVAVIWETIDSTEVGDAPAPRRVEGRRIAVIRRRELARPLPHGSIIVEADAKRWRVQSIARDDGTDLRFFVVPAGRDIDTSGPGGA